MGTSIARRFGGGGEAAIGRTGACVDGGEAVTFAEFFAGIGLVHLGLRPFGWRCVYANDISPDKREMYEGLFGRAEYYHLGDVWRTAEVIERCPAAPTLATASFPCVDLSLAGNRKGLAGAQSGAFYGFLRVLTEMRQNGGLPRLLLIENVLGFLSSREGADFAEVVESLSHLGYAIDALVVDAKHFVPQSRPRLFVIGCHTDWLGERSGLDDWASEPSAIRPAPLLRALERARLQTRRLNLLLPALPAVQRTIDRAIDTGDDQEWWGGDLVAKHLGEMSPLHRGRIARLADARGDSVGTIYRRVRGGVSRSEIRTDGLAGCLRTPRGGSSRQIVFVAGHGTLRMRWMSPREYARLQGAPDFPLPAERNKALYGMGDAVCVPAISWIAEHALRPLMRAWFAERVAS